MAYLQCPSKSKCYGIMRTRSLFQRFPMSATVLRSMWSCFTVPDTGSPFGTHVRFHALGLGRHSGRGPKVLHGSSPSHHWFRSRRKMPMTSLLQLNDDIWGINGFYNKTLQCLLSLMINDLALTFDGCFFSKRCSYKWPDCSDLTSCTDTKDSSMWKYVKHWGPLVWLH